MTRSIDFIKWLKMRGEMLSWNEHVPRKLYGKYLRDTFLKIQKRHNIRLYDEFACDLKVSRNGYRVTLSSNNQIESSYVILCLGVSQMKSSYNVEGYDSFIENPYPLHQKLLNINKDAHVLILGSGLSAIDVCIYLKNHLHVGKITLFSRSGRLPIIRSPVEKYTPQICLLKNFLKIRNPESGTLSLRQILRLVRKELKLVGVNWKTVFFPKTDDSGKRFVERYQSAQENQPFLDVLLAIQHEVDLAWAFLKKKDKLQFARNYLSNILKVIAPIPMQNANILSEMFSSQQLEIIGGQCSLQENQNTEKFVAIFNDKETKCVDVIVNAIGFSNHITEKSNKLNLLKLEKRRIISRHPGGGILVCPMTGRVHSSSKKLYAIGHLTTGEHPLINNIELILLNAKSTLFSILTELKLKRSSEYIN